MAGRRLEIVLPPGADAESIAGDVEDALARRLRVARTDDACAAAELLDGHDAVVLLQPQGGESGAADALRDQLRRALVEMRRLQAEYESTYTELRSLRRAHRHVLWSVLPAHSPRARGLQGATRVDEDAVADGRLGEHLELLEEIGHGAFSSVRACRRAGGDERTASSSSSSGERARSFDSDRTRSFDDTEDVFFLEDVPPGGGAAAAAAAAPQQAAPQLAAKVVPKELSLDGMLGVAAEIDALSTLHHRNIAALHQVLQTPTSVFLVMARGSEDLARYARERYPEGVPEATARALVRQLCDAMAYAHGIGFAHRDLKPENVVLHAGDGHCVIVDWGNAQRAGSAQRPAVVGSPGFFPPEVLTHPEHVDDRAVDAWGIGCTLLALLSGSAPGDFFSSVWLPAYETRVDDPMQLHTALQLALRRVDGVRRDDLSVDCVNFLRAMLHLSPGARTSPEDALRHPWLRSLTVEVGPSGGGSAPAPGRRSSRRTRSSPSGGERGLGGGSDRAPSRPTTPRTRKSSPGIATPPGGSYRSPPGSYRSPTGSSFRSPPGSYRSPPGDALFSHFGGAGGGSPGEQLSSSAPAAHRNGSSHGDAPGFYSIEAAAPVAGGASSSMRRSSTLPPVGQ